MSSAVLALLRDSSVKHEHGNLTTRVQSTWKGGNRHWLEAQLGTDPSACQQRHTKPGTTENSLWSFPFLLMACSCSCVIQLSRCPRTLPIRPDHVQGAEATAPNYACPGSGWVLPVLGRLWLQDEGEDVTTAREKALLLSWQYCPRAVRDVQWVPACDRYNNNHTLYDTDSTFGFLTGVCCRVSFLSDKTELKKKKEIQSHGSFPFKRQHS